MISPGNSLNALRKYWLTIALILGLTVGFGIYVKSEKEIDRANDRRVLSLVLGHQLRVSSDELAQMARAYVATGNPAYKNYFQDIMDIRDGKLPRPAGYMDAYWDFVVAGEVKPVRSGKTTPALLELMRGAGLEDEEIQLFAEAKRRSDSLSAVDLQAMELSRSANRDTGDLLAKAIRQQYDSSYLKAKAAVMKPINDAQQRINKRTNEDVLDAEFKATVFRIVLLVFIIGLCLTLWRTHLITARENAEREKAEAALRESESGLNAIIERALDAVVRMNERGLIIGWNARAEEVFGWVKQEAIGRRLDTLIIPEAMRNSHLRGLAAYLETGVEKVLNRRVEVTAVRKSGEEFPVELSITQLKSRGKHQFTAFIEDITQRKLSERKLEDQNVTLEALVVKRTAEFSAAKDAAESANRAKSIFLANMSHELRTPLNSILGFSNLLEREPGQGEGSRKKLASINRAGQHLLTLINDVLEISRIEAGRIVIGRESIDVENFIYGVEELIRVRASEKELQFHVAYDGDLPDYVEGDPGHTKQILFNLLGNAVKYTEQGGVTLRVGYLNGQMTFRIKDTGPGIGKEEQERLFQPFYQTAVGIAKGDGTGLGLAICREYAALMDGDLSLHSEAGQGTEFTVVLPMPVTTTPPRSKPEASSVIGLEEGQPEYRVLQVDDKEDNRELVRELLTGVGFLVRTACNGEEAVRIFSEWRPQFICMDMRMPVMNGFDATRKIRSLPGGDQVKIVALTASVFEEDRPGILTAGCDEILRKPLDPDRLFALMRDMLGIRYRYVETVPRRNQVLLGELNLSNLPKELLSALQSSALRLDLKSLREIAGRITAENPSQGSALNRLIADYKFEAIADHCKGLTTGTNHG